MILYATDTGNTYFCSHHHLPPRPRGLPPSNAAATHPDAMNRNGERRKRKERGDLATADYASPSSASFDRHVFPILLAAAQTTRQNSNSCSPAALAARLLRRVLSRSPQMLYPLPDSLVALLPRLLSSR